MNNIKINPCFSCGDSDLTLRYDIHDEYSVVKIMCNTCGVIWKVPVIEDEDADSAQINTKAVFKIISTWNRMERMV